MIGAATIRPRQGKTGMPAPTKAEMEALRATVAQLAEDSARLKEQMSKLVEDGASLRAEVRKSRRGARKRDPPEPE